jgi:hypothetical protein
MEIVFDMATADKHLEEGPGGIQRDLVGNFRTLGQKFDALIKGKLLMGEVLDRRTGMGQRSIFYRVEDDPIGNTVTLIVGANLAIAPYMRILAYGGTIRPKTGRFLTIPLDAAKTPSGVARFSARDVINDPQAHGYASTFFRNQMLFGVRADAGPRVMREGRHLVPLFALKTQVQIPQNNYLAIAKDRLHDDTRAAVFGAVVSGLKPNPGVGPGGEVQVS